MDPRFEHDVFVSKRAMTDTQSTPADGAAKENPEVRFLRSFIAVFKDNRDVLPSLPEIIECLMTNEEQASNLIERRRLEENRFQSCKYSYYYTFYYTQYPLL